MTLFFNICCMALMVIGMGLSLMQVLTGDTAETIVIFPIACFGFLFFLLRLVTIMGKKQEPPQVPR